jgi:hypothetical protein
MPQASMDLFATSNVPVVMGSASTKPVPLHYKERRLKTLPLADSIYEPYRIGRIEISGARAHPTPLVEASTMASVLSPMPTYRPMLPPLLVSDATLSGEQLESIIYAGNAHRSYFTFTTTRTIEHVSMTIADGIPVETKRTEKIEETFALRYGYLIGDGTGIGKGRKCAGIMLDNVNQGRTRAVYLTSGSILINDIKRDWCDLGGDEADIVHLKKYPLGKLHSLKDRDSFILAGTYSLFQRSKDDRNRVDDLVDLLGSDFDGVIILDEAHYLANADPVTTDEQQGGKRSRQGAALLDLQLRLPDARIVYVGATALPKVDALAYAVRLGLFGTESAFPTQRAFITAMARGGTAALETVARDLKSRGLMCASQLSMEDSTIERFEHTLDEVQVRNYNDYVRVWQMIHGGIDRELIFLNAVDADPERAETPKPTLGSPYASLHGKTSVMEQLFLSQAIHSLQMPTIIEVIRQKRAAGRAVVCQLTHTGEGALRAAVAAQGADVEMDEVDIDAIDTTHRQSLINFVMHNYPIHFYERVYDPKVKEKVPKVIVDPVTGLKPISPEAVLRRDELIAAIKDIVFPLPILDQLHEAFPGEVAEISGRRMWIETIALADGSTTQRISKRKESDNTRAVEQFQNGEKMIVAFTEGAGGQGISLHASRKIKNQARRAHLICEMSWNTASAIQGMGRTPRADQVVGPEYAFFSISNLPAQRRLQSTPARKAAVLGALSKGHREAADNAAFRQEDNLESVWAERAMAQLFTDVRDGKVEGLTREAFESAMRIDLGRIEIVPSTEKWLESLRRGHKLYRMGMTRILNRLMCVPIGFDGGMQQQIMAAFFSRLDDVVATAIENGLYDTGVEILSAESITVVSTEQLYVDHFGASTNITELQIVNPPAGTYTLGMARQAAYDHEREYGPGTAVWTIRADAVELHLHYGNQSVVYTPFGWIRRARLKRIKSIDDATISAAWNDAYARMPRSQKTMYLATGCLTPIWARMPQASPVYRVRTDDEQILLGRLIHHEDIERVRTAFSHDLRIAA